MSEEDCVVLNGGGGGVGQTAESYVKRKDSLNDSSNHSRSNSGASSSSSSAILLSVANLNKPSSNGVTAASNLERDCNPKDGQHNHQARTNSGSSSGEDECDRAAASGADMMAHKDNNLAAPTSSRTLSPSSMMGQADSQSEVPASSTTPTASPINHNNNVKCFHKEGEACGEVIKLQGALASLQDKLHLKDEEIARLSRIRDDVEAELEDLTASLFEEAHKMVRDANVKQASAEKALVEANMKVEGLETEVAALKTLVLTSTPSQPNKHLHPQLADKKKNKKGNNNGKNLNGSSDSVASTSSGRLLATTATNGGLVPNGSPVLAAGHHGRDGSFSLDDSEACNAATSSDCCPGGGSPNVSINGSVASGYSGCMEEQSVLKSIDPTLRKDFLSWRKTPALDRTRSPFLERVYREDVDLCLNFPNVGLAQRVTAAIHANALCLTPVKDFSQVPRDCALLQAPVLCRYTLRLLNHDESTDDSSEDEVHHISQLSRNRLTSACDLLTYLRYVHQGLVKAHVNEVYWEIMRLRRQMVLARFGYMPES